MSEYQYYRFERTDGFLSTKQRSELRDISSRAEITSTSFKVDYHYSDLRAEPAEVMLDNFDVGFYFANWGDMIVYIKLPLNTVPEAFLAAVDDCQLELIESKEYQLLILSMAEYEEYFDDEQADEFFAYLGELRAELIEGDYRLLYFQWLQRAAYGETVEALPLLNFDFAKLTPAQQAFVCLFYIPEETLRTMTLLITQGPCHQVKQSNLSADEWLSELSLQNKDMLLKQLFEQGQLAKSEAVLLTKQSRIDVLKDYEYWLTFEKFAEHYPQARQQIAQERAELAEKQALQKKQEKENRLNQLYGERESIWQTINEQAELGTARGYDNAAETINELYEAYLFKAQQVLFKDKFLNLYRRIDRRPALLKRLAPLNKKL